MSAVTSPSLLKSNQSFDELLAFDSAEGLSQAWHDGLTPDPALTVSEWADRHRVLSPRASAEPGRYRADRTPYMRAITDALSPTHSARRIVVMKSAQVGFTECGNNWIGYVIHHAPGPMLAVQPTVELAKRFSRQRIDPLIAESPALRERVRPARSRDAGNTVLSKEFPAGLLVITGANSAVGLRSMPARYLFLDEVDAYPPSADEEGDPVALAEARTRTFSWRSKILLGSTPTIQGSRASSGNTKARTNDATSSPARIAGTCNGSGSNGSAGTKANPRPPITNVAPATAGSRSSTRPRCSRPANGARPQKPKILGPSASTSRRSIRRSDGIPGLILPGCGRQRRATRPGAASKTPSSARPGSRSARRRTGSGSTSAVSRGRSARCRRAVCS